jgi:hypothetical protein
MSSQVKGSDLQKLGEGPSILSRITDALACINSTLALGLPAPSCNGSTTGIHHEENIQLQRLRTHFLRFVFNTKQIHFWPTAQLLTDFGGDNEAVGVLPVMAWPA